MRLNTETVKVEDETTVCEMINQDKIRNWNEVVRAVFFRSEVPAKGLIRIAS